MVTDISLARGLSVEHDKQIAPGASLIECESDFFPGGTGQNGEGREGLGWGSSGVG